MLAALNKDGMASNTGPVPVVKRLALTVAALLVHGLDAETWSVSTVRIGKAEQEIGQTSFLVSSCFHSSYDLLASAGDD